MERPWRDVLTLLCWRHSVGVCVRNRELSLLVKLTQHHPVGSHLWWRLIKFEVQRKRFAPDIWKIKALPRERWCYLVFQGSDQRSWNSSPCRTLDVLPNLQPNSVSVLQRTDILLLSQITPAVFRGLLLHATSDRDISRRQGLTQYCHGVILHQFHWVYSEFALPLIGCLAVITTSNNDRYFKENRENWKQENRHWFLFFLGILFSIFGIFFDNTVTLHVYVLRMQSSHVILCQSKFFMMPGFSYVRRHFAL